MVHGPMNLRHQIMVLAETDSNMLNSVPFSLRVCTLGVLFFLVNFMKNHSNCHLLVIYFLWDIYLYKILLPVNLGVSTKRYGCEEFEWRHSFTLCCLITDLSLELLFFNHNVYWYFLIQVTERKSQLAKLEAMDCGKPLDEASWDIVGFPIFCDSLVVIYVIVSMFFFVVSLCKCSW